MAFILKSLTIVIVPLLFWTCCFVNLASGEVAQIQTIELTIDYGDGVKKQFAALNWKSGMTVLDAMKKAKKHPHGITFKSQGSGSIAMLTKIDDLKNQGGRGKNWIYWINDKIGDRSFAVKSLSPSDHVLWKFARYEYNAKK